MAEQNDHDLLVILNTKVEMVISLQTSSIQANKELAERVARLEVKDSRDSEKVATISEDVRRSLSNSARIETLAADMNALGETIRDLKAKSNLWDIGNSIAVAIAAVLGWFAR